MTDLPEPHLDGFVRVRGARENNLRDVDVDVPRNALVVFTGVSGSGKSSLAFGTIYAEAQRRYFESVAPYARRLIQQAAHPRWRRSPGCRPPSRCSSAAGRRSSRSTVGTLTTLSNSLRMLFSRAGTYPRGAAQLDSDAFSPNTAAGACPECHGLGHRAHRHRGLPGPGPLAEHPRRRHRRLARGLAGQEPARHPHPPRLRRRHPLAEAAQEATATGSCSPRSSPWWTSTPAAGPRRQSRTTAGSGAPGATCCTPSPTPRAPPCASGRCASCETGPCPVCGGTGSGPRRSP